MEDANMDRVTRCLHCGKRMVPAPSLTGRTELICIYCDKTDPIEIAKPQKWADGTSPHLNSETVS
jgi:hypothetical protein